MSYLNFPRLHFAGRFRADVSTVNNDVRHFKDPNDPPRQGWNPAGSALWRLDGRITGATRADGTPAQTADSDPVIELTFAQTGSARLVDLDPQQQMTSQIWGMQLRLAKAGGTAFSGRFRVTAFSDLWQRARGEEETEFPLGACFQSVLTDVTWGDVADSLILRELRQATREGLLSIKFNVDGFVINSAATDFTTGRVVGAIGPALAGEPDHFVVGRHCMPIGEDPPINFFPAGVDRARGKLHVDLGNALTTAAAGKALDTSHRLEIGLLEPKEQFTSLGTLRGWESAV